MGKANGSFHESISETKMMINKAKKIASLRADAEDEDDSETFMNPAKKKSTRGRKRLPRDEDGNIIRGKPAAIPQQRAESLSENAAPVDLEAVRTALKPVALMISNVGVKVAETQDAAMTMDEMTVILDAATNCVNQYLPAVLGAHASAVTLSLMLAQYSYRVYTLRQLQLEKLIAERRREQGLPNERVTTVPDVGTQNLGEPH